jgi:hypothetical protein
LNRIFISSHSLPPPPSLVANPVFHPYDRCGHNWVCRSRGRVRLDNGHVPRGRHERKARRTPVDGVPFDSDVRNCGRLVRPFYDKRVHSRVGNASQRSSASGAAGASTDGGGPDVDTPTWRKPLLELSLFRDASPTLKAAASISSEASTRRSRRGQLPNRLQHRRDDTIVRTMQRLLQCRAKRSATSRHPEGRALSTKTTGQIQERMEKAPTHPPPSPHEDTQFLGIRQRQPKQSPLTAGRRRVAMSRRCHLHIRSPPSSNPRGHEWVGWQKVGLLNE